VRECFEVHVIKAVRQQQQHQQIAAQQITQWLLPCYVKCARPVAKAFNLKKRHGKWNVCAVQQNPPARLKTDGLLAAMLFRSICQLSGFGHPQLL
jgi:hypothetical protein